MKVPYGESDYRKIKEENYLYIDKTMFLERLENVGSKILYLRPRRFGKTLFTSMMYNYYDINGKDKFDTLFKNTYVYNNPTPYKNGYYILKFDFSGMSVDSSNEECIVEEFKNKIVMGIKEFVKHYDIKYNDIDESKSSTYILSNFISNLNLEHKLYIIIDEYDNFTNSILSNNKDMFRKILGCEGFVKAFYARIKEYCGNGVVDRVFITGVCSISLDSMTSGFNIATNITTDPWFNSMTALTHDEVKNLIQGLENGENHFNTMVENYDGYKFSREDEELVFNPTLTMYYMKNLITRGCPPLDLLDSNIISNFKQLKNIISLGDTREILDDIFDNGEIASTLTVNYSDDTRFNREDIISLLFYFGYLTIKSGVGGEFYKFRIPNRVITSVYGKYYMSIMEEYNIVPTSFKDLEVYEEIQNEGKINKLCNYVSDFLKSASDRLYINFKEKDLQILSSAILIRFSEMDVYLEYPSFDNYIDMYIKSKNYHIIVELKYIKKKDRREYKKIHSSGLEQLNNYTLENISNDKIRKYLVIFTGSDYTIDEVKVD